MSIRLDRQSTTVPKTSKRRTRTGLMNGQYANAGGIDFRGGLSDAAAMIYGMARRRVLPPLLAAIHPGSPPRRWPP
jgi:hypothetical protein